MVDLSHIQLATEEDLSYGIDRWALLFKAKTWEELKMIAKDDLAMIEAAENLYVLNADEQARARALARQEAVIHEKAMQQRQADLERQLTEQQEARERARKEALIHEQAMQQRQADLERQLAEQQEARERARKEALIHEQAMQQRQADLERQKSYLEQQLTESAEKYQTAMAEIEQLRAKLAGYRKD